MEAYMTKLKLFCLPYAGGSASAYNKWNKKLCEEISVIPVELSGRGKRIIEPLYASFSECLEDLTEKIAEEIDEKPFALYGHSMGAKIIYELYYSILNKMGKMPVYLFFSGSNPPEIRTDKMIYKLSDQKLKDTIIALGGTSQEVIDNPEVFDYFLPIIRSDFFMDETYIFEQKSEKLQCNVMVLAGKNDTNISLKEIRLWENYTTGRCKYYLYPGEHFMTDNEQNIVLKLIQGELLAYIT